ncbi:MAG: NAD(P)/FAD-dependent oxidoreductase [Lautropia sp.]
MFDTECVIVGGGAIGLAIARRLALDGREVVLLERAATIGTETSARSNEVIHAGIYHRPGGPQAVLCGRGRELLYAYCATHGIAHRQIGKLIVATDDASVGWLEQTHETARVNDVPALTMLTGEAAQRLEPQLRCRAALWSQRTGIVDTHGLMLAYRGDAEAAGAAVACNSRFVSASRVGGKFDVDVACADEGAVRLHCAWLINAAGIWAPEVARAIEGMTPEHIPTIHLAKGGFFALRGRSPFSRLIVPEPRTWRQGGILTLDLAGRSRFGPDEIWVDEVDYDLTGHAFGHVYDAVRRYFPALPDDALSPDYAGIRPRLNGPGEAPADWLFQDEARHGVGGLINLFGFESPGITASLAIADAVAGLLSGRALPFEVGPLPPSRLAGSC